MPTLRELQREFACAVTGGALNALDLAPPMTPRLEIYRNTRRSTLTAALGLAFPAVRALVGTEFFAALSAQFIASTPPVSAYLNDYGAELPQFLRSYAPAASICYLSAVAQLEWAVSRACHAPDVARLDPQRLATLCAADLPRVVFCAHPSVALLRLAYPADCIWRAVLEQDERAMRSIDLESGPAHLLVERDFDDQVQVRRLAPPAWQLTERLLTGDPWYQVLPAEPARTAGEAGTAEASAASILAEHLAARRFVGFHLAATGD